MPPISKTKLKAAMKAQGRKMPHGYQVVARKKRTVRKKSSRRKR